VHESTAAPSADWRFAGAVAGFGLLLRESPHAGTLGWDDVRRLGRAGLGADRDGDRAEFLRLVDRAERVMRPQVATRREER
jgi:Ca-activated chloride channel family protein